MTGTLNAETAKDSRTRIDIAIEVLTLFGLVSIPLLFRGREWVSFYSQPKFFLLHFTALTIVVLWSVEIALDAAKRRPESSSIFERADRWIAEARHRWTIVAVAGFSLAYVISTLLSPMPWVSVWGRDFGDLGYDTYSTLSYLVIFFTIALRTRTSDQLFRIALAVAAVGTLSAAYGVSQSFGWDPIGRGENLRRVVASYGNPLFLGAYLVMSIPIVAAVALHEDSKGRWWALVPGTISIGLHLAALWYAGGRGAWIASVFGLAIFVIASSLWLGRTRALKAMLLSVGGGATVLLITSLPGGTSETGRGLDQLRHVLTELGNGVRYVFQDPADPPVFVVVPSDGPATTPENPVAGAADPTGAESEVVPTPTIPPALQSPVGRPAPITLADAAQIESFGLNDPRSLAVSNRANIWRGAIELVATRERVEDDPGLVHGLRYLFGFGPDMYFYSYPITSRPLTGLETTSHAHNYLLQVLLEQGLVGLVMFAATAVLVFLTAISILRHLSRRDNAEPWLSILIVGVIAALLARAVEQSVGVGRVSDLVTFWALMGLVVAGGEIAYGSPHRTRQRSHLRLSAAGFRQLAPFGAVVLAGVVLLVVFIQKDVRTLQAGWVSANAFEQKRDGDANEAFRSFQEARDLAPDVERYYTEIAGLLTRSAAPAEDLDRARELYAAARDTLLEYEDRDRLAWQTQLGLASVTAALAGLGDETLIPEVVGRYLNLSALMKPFPSVQATAAENIVLAREYEIGEVVAERAIALEANTGPVPGAWWALGESAFQLGRIEDAELAWETSIKRQGSGVYAARSHRGLGFINEARGDDELAAEHHQRADELEAD
ncbi:MAG: O-antigen ligase family protein [Chloroflexi bacterium]|nr:O-antigen ligase family protein [Chloroflexota bacterium]